MSGTDERHHEVQLGLSQRPVELAGKCKQSVHSHPCKSIYRAHEAETENIVFCGAKVTNIVVVGTPSVLEVPEAALHACVSDFEIFCEVLYQKVSGLILSRPASQCSVDD